MRASSYLTRRACAPLATLWLGVSCLLAAPLAGAADVLVLEFELNDLTLYPKVEQERARVASLRPLLLEALADVETIDTAALPGDAATEAAHGAGYLFDRPTVAARLGRESGADWVVTGRLHKASHLFVYLKAQLVDTVDGRIAADFVVEIKGWGEKLTRKGVEALALQIEQSIVSLEGVAEAEDG